MPAASNPAMRPNIRARAMGTSNRARLQRHRKATEWYGRFVTEQLQQLKQLLWCLRGSSMRPTIELVPCKTKAKFLQAPRLNTGADFPCSRRDCYFRRAMLA